jgi:hypothetical protein
MALSEARVGKLLRRSKKFRRKIDEWLRDHDESVDLTQVNLALDQVDTAIMELGRKTPSRSRQKSANTRTRRR